jgi:hypothetical protein
MTVMKGIERASAALGLLLCLVGLVWMFMGRSSEAVIGNANVVGGICAVVGLGWLLLQAFRGQSLSVPDPPGGPIVPNPPVESVESGGPEGPEGAGEPVALAQPGVAWPGSLPQRVAVSAIAVAAVVICLALFLPRGHDEARSAAAPASPAPGPATRFVSPVDGAQVPFHSTAHLAISAQDADLHGSVLAMSICVSGGCYLEEEIQIAGGRASYDLYLGSTAGQGVGIAWTVRVDRLTSAEFSTLRTEREQAIAAGTWGGKVSTSMSGLNPAPVASVTVTKAP